MTTNEVMPLRDYSQSRAVLIGTWAYDNRDPVPAVGNSFERMGGMLGGPNCEWPQQSIQAFANENRLGDLPDKITSIFQDARDVALFYYVGHGLMDEYDELCLSLSGTRNEPYRISTTSLPYMSVRRALQNSPAKTKIIILDCCYSGSAIRRQSQSAEDDIQAAISSGAFLMAACTNYGTAWWEEDVDDTRAQTYFTKHLVDIVDSGIPGEAEVLRLGPLYQRLRLSLIDAELPVPTAQNIDSADTFAFARNATPREVLLDTATEIERLHRDLRAAEERERILMAEAQRQVAKVKKIKKRLRRAQTRSIAPSVSSPAPYTSLDPYAPPSPVHSSSPAEEYPWADTPVARALSLDDFTSNRPEESLNTSLRPAVSRRSLTEPGPGSSREYRRASRTLIKIAAGIVLLAIVAIVATLIL